MHKVLSTLQKFSWERPTRCPKGKFYKSNLLFHSCPILFNELHGSWSHSHISKNKFSKLILHSVFTGQRIIMCQKLQWYWGIMESHIILLISTSALHWVAPWATPLCPRIWPLFSHFDNLISWLLPLITSSALATFQPCLAVAWFNSCSRTCLTTDSCDYQPMIFHHFASFYSSSDMTFYYDFFSLINTL